MSAQLTSFGSQGLAPWTCVSAPEHTCSSTPSCSLSPELRSLCSKTLEIEPTRAVMEVSSHFSCFPTAQAEPLSPPRTVETAQQASPHRQRQSLSLLPPPLTSSAVVRASTSALFQLFRCDRAPLESINTLEATGDSWPLDPGPLYLLFWNLWIDGVDNGSDEHPGESPADAGRRPGQRDVKPTVSPTSADVQKVLADLGRKGGPESFNPAAGVEDSGVETGVDSLNPGDTLPCEKSVSDQDVEPFFEPVGNNGSDASSPTPSPRPDPPEPDSRERGSSEPDEDTDGIVGIVISTIVCRNYLSEIVRSLSGNNNDPC
ncbi:hypothetical protein QBC39DRAFT_438230 [Podospora conica]|nr:hypothetical protein QBC39DRAFT_438230 [Schizothecium conicum]